MMRTEPIKPCHGGTRQGAGRKAAYGEPTKTVRVPQSLAPFVVTTWMSLSFRHRHWARHLL